MSTTTTNKIPVGDAISQVAKEEGGTTKGSKSAKMQSAATRSMNQQGGQGDVAGQTVSEVIKELKGGQPEKGGPAAKMQSAVGKERNAAQGVGNSVVSTLLSTEVTFLQDYIVPPPLAPSDLQAQFPTSWYFLHANNPFSLIEHRKSSYQRYNAICPRP